MEEMQKSYFLVVSRLVPYKKVDLAVRAFNKNGLPLVVVGTGSEEAKLKKIAKNNIQFVGYVTDAELMTYYKNCKALIFPQNEDFGLVAVEAIAMGKPVIAYKAGGALDIIKDNKNGLFFEKQTVTSLNNAIKRFAKMKWSSDIIVFTSARFSTGRFKREFLSLIK